MELLSEISGSGGGLAQDNSVGTPAPTAEAPFAVLSKVTLPHNHTGLGTL